MKLHRDLLARRKNFFHFYGPAPESENLKDPGALRHTQLNNWLSFLLSAKLLQKRNESFELHSLLLMSNHFHGVLAVSLAESKRQLLELEAYLHDARALKAGEALRLREITNITDYYQTHRYIAYNPVEAHLVTSFMDYEFSSYAIFVGRSKLPVQPIRDTLHLMLNPFRFLIDESYRG
jgi:REP element-mobilizing transposase RayT